MAKAWSARRCSRHCRERLVIMTTFDVIHMVKFMTWPIVQVS